VLDRNRLHCPFCRGVLEKKTRKVMRTCGGSLRPEDRTEVAAEMPYWWCPACQVGLRIQKVALEQNA